MFISFHQVFLCISICIGSVVLKINHIFWPIGETKVYACGIPSGLNSTHRTISSKENSVWGRLKFLLHICNSPYLNWALYVQDLRTTLMFDFYTGHRVGPPDSTCMLHNLCKLFTSSPICIFCFHEKQQQGMWQLAEKETTLRTTYTHMNLPNYYGNQGCQIPLLFQ